MDDLLYLLRDSHNLLTKRKEKEKTITWLQLWLFALTTTSWSGCSWVQVNVCAQFKEIPSNFLWHMSMGRTDGQLCPEHRLCEAFNVFVLQCWGVINTLCAHRRFSELNSDSRNLRKSSWPAGSFRASSREKPHFFTLCWLGSLLGRDGRESQCKHPRNNKTLKLIMLPV